MFDWIGSLASEVDFTFKLVVSVVAGIIALYLCHKGGWALSRIIISVLSVAFLVVAITNMNVFAKKIETDVKKAAPAIVQVVAPTQAV